MAAGSRRLRAVLGAAAVLVGTLGAAPPAASAATGVTSCGTLATAGYYALVANLSVVDASCIVVTASNVTLDLAGHTVSCTGSGFAGSCQTAGAGPTAVNVRPGLVGVAVRGPGVIAGFDNGILVESSDATISGVTVTGPACDAADCQRPVSNAIVVLGKVNGDGSVDAGPASVSIVGNTVSNNGRGIALLGTQCSASGTGCAVYGNTAVHNTGLECNGILLSGVTGYAVVGNQAHANGAGDCFPPGGIAAGGSSGNVIANNDASSNIGFGIGIGPESNGNTIAGNTARGNTGADLSAFPGTVNNWSDSNVCNTEQGAVPPSVCNPGE